MFDASKNEHNYMRRVRRGVFDETTIYRRGHEAFHFNLYHSCIVLPRREYNAIVRLDFEHDDDGPFK